jgi:hypothetical protein
VTSLRLRQRPRFVVSIAVAVAFGVGAVGCSGSDDQRSASVTNIVAPDEVTAGSTIEIVVEGRRPGDVELDVIDAFAATTFAATMSDGRATITLPAALSSTSGLVTFVAHGIDDEGRTDSVVATTMIVPDGAAAEVDIHAGPRTIIADGVDQTMVTAIAADSFGNPLRDGEAVIISLVDESGPDLKVTAAVDHGIAARLIAADTSAGSIEVFATADSGASSRRVGFEEVPGAATSVQSVLAGTLALVADGRTLLDISTAVIADRFGNRLPDGHLVQLHSDGPNGVGVATATTIDGIARFRLIAPSRPGTVSIEVAVDGITGETAELAFTAAVSSIPIDIVRDDSNRAAVQVGPVLDELGAVVTDGTPVTATIGDRVDPIEVPLLNGVAEIDLGTLDPDTEIVIEVLGVTRTVTR